MLHIIVDVSYNLLRESASKQSVRFLWSCPAYAGQLWRATFVALYFAQPEVGRQQLMRRVIAVRAKCAYCIPCLAVIKEILCAR